jgi:hypothetical protein
LKSPLASRGRQRYLGAMKNRTVAVCCAALGLGCASTGTSISLKLYRCTPQARAAAPLAVLSDTAACEGPQGFCTAGRRALDRCRSTLRTELPQRGLTASWPLVVNTDSTGRVTSLCMAEGGSLTTPRTLGCVLRALEQAEIPFPPSERDALWPVTLSTE